MKTLFFLLTSIFLLSFGPFNSKLSNYRLTWNELIFVLSLLIIFYFYYKKAFRFSEHNILVVCCLLYFGAILINFIIHNLSLVSLPDAFPVNVAHVNTKIWQGQNIKFSIFYLFFPTFYLLNYVILKKVDENFLVLSFAVPLIISMAVLFYQFFSDLSFFNIPIFIRQQRVGGLFTDPNAFAMSSFLLIPLFSIIQVFRLKKSLRIFYSIIILSLVVGMLLSKSRTGFGGLALLAVSALFILAISCKQWPKFLRFILILSPLLFALLCFFILPIIFEYFHSTGMEGLLLRLTKTYNIFEEKGLKGVFFYREHRGLLFSIAWALLWKAPWAGWGPGGFYREFPNEFFIRSGLKKHAFDSSLNHYLMIGGDLGIPALLINLILLAAPIGIAIYTLRKLTDLKERLLITTLITTNIIFLLIINTIPPSYFLGLIWIWTAQLTYMIIIGERNGIFFRIKNTKQKIIFYCFVILFLVPIIFGTYQTTFGSKGYLARSQSDQWSVEVKYDMNCYNEERWDNGNVRWCSKNSFMKIPVERDLPQTLTLKFFLNHPDLASNPVTVTIGGKNEKDFQETVNQKGWKTIEIPLTDKYIFSYLDSKTSLLKKYIVLSFDVSRTWVPEQWGVSQDKRKLGLAVLLPDL